MSFPRLHKRLFTEEGAGETIKHEALPEQDKIPDQSGQSGKFLTTDGDNTSWAAVDALPAQTGHSGKFLTTDGSDASWATVDALPSQSGQSGKFLTTDGSAASWATVDLSSKQDASTAVKHTESTASGSATQPVYVASDGTATPITYSLNKTVPSDAVFTDTTYSAGSGLSLNGTTINHSNSVDAVSTASLKKVAYDAQGHITDSSDVVKADITGLGIPASDTTYALTQDSSDGHKITLTPSSGTATTITIPDNNTTYTGSNGVTLNGTNFVNSGVRSISSGETNGTISVNTNGTSAEVAITGLGDLAYKSSLVASDIPSITKSKISDFPSSLPASNTTDTYSSTGSDPTSGKAVAQAIATVTTTSIGAIPTSQKGAASGVAELDSTGKVPSSQLPAFVDDVVEGYYDATEGKFYKDAEKTEEIEGESGKIYVDLSTNKTYRWSGSAFVEISASLALGETSTTAYRGDRGKTAYDHSQSTHARTDATAVSSSTTNGNIKINGTETTVYTHPTATAAASGLYKVTVDGTGHVTATTAVAKSDITGLGIPSSDTNTTYTLTQDSSDGHKITLTPSSGSATTITIPDNNTTYSAGTGLTLSGTQFKHSNSVTAGTAGTSSATSGSTLAVPYVSYDAQGHVTGSGTHTHTVTGFAASSHSHDYEPTSTAVRHTASTAVGNATQPVYIASDGKATAISYTIAKSVPSDANFSNTTYSAGTGLSLSGTTFNHASSVTAGTAGTSSATSGSTLAVPYVTYNATGHVTAAGTHTHTITGFAASSHTHPYTTYYGNHTEATSGTTASSPTEGMAYSSGLYLTGAYSASSWAPCTYGNVINVAGGGTGQILCEWSGADSTSGRLYYRSHRDTASGGWGAWRTMMDETSFESVLDTLIAEY